MKTLRECLIKRSIDCCVETPVAVYNGNAKYLLTIISNNELDLEIKYCILETRHGNRAWNITTINN